MGSSKPDTVCRKAELFVCKFGSGITGLVIVRYVSFKRNPRV